MSSTFTSGRRRTGRIATLAIGAAVATTASLMAPAATAATTPADLGITQVGGVSPLSTNPADYKTGDYLVQFVGDPLAAYEGDVRGYAATKPAKGSKLDADSAAAKKYQSRLVSQQDAALKTAGVKPANRFTAVYNGVGARLTSQQAAKLASAKGVVSISRTQLLKRQTDQSPQFLKMPQLWKDAGGRADAGKGVVVGVIDSGIWYESKSLMSPESADQGAQGLERRVRPRRRRLRPAVQRQDHRCALLRRRLRRGQHRRRGVPLPARR